MLIGLFLLLIGGLLLISQIFMLSFSILFLTYWPILLVIYGGIRLFAHQRSTAFSWTLILFGGLLLLKSFDILPDNFGRILIALLLILLGIRMMRTRNRSDCHAGGTGDSEHGGYTHYTAPNPHAETKRAGIHEQDFINDQFILTNDYRVYRSNAFTGGKIDVNFSSVTLDLKNVWPGGPEIKLVCNVNFGELAIDVPADWHVIIDGKHYYSKTEISHDQTPTTTLIIESHVFAGSLRIL